MFTPVIVTYTPNCRGFAYARLLAMPQSGKLTYYFWASSCLMWFATAVKRQKKNCAENNWSKTVNFRPKGRFVTSHLTTVSLKCQWAFRRHSELFWLPWVLWHAQSLKHASPTYFHHTYKYSIYRRKLNPHPWVWQCIMQAYLLVW